MLKAYRIIGREVVRGTGCHHVTFRLSTTPSFPWRGIYTDMCNSDMLDVAHVGNGLLRVKACEIEGFMYEHGAKVSKKYAKQLWEDYAIALAKPISSNDYWVTEDSPLFYKEAE